MYTMSDGKNKLLLHCYTNLRDEINLFGLMFWTDGAS